MKKNILFLLKDINLIILFVIKLHLVVPQSDCDNLFKYWKYRNRLQYFVIPGEKKGESQIIGLRNRFDETYNDFAPNGTRYYKVSTPGQHGVLFGYYISMLATEYKLLMNYGKTTEVA